MADIFLSYAREDLERVRPLIAAIEAGGKSVWYDQSLRAGADFGAETAAALDGAKAVVVVWSPHSVASKWVRDEASVGRDASILIPISLDGASPPLGFRQIQTIDFGGWKGDPSAPAVKTLIAALDGAPAAPAGAVVARKAPWTERFLKPVPLAAGAAALALIVVVALLPSFLTRPAGAPHEAESGSAAQTPPHPEEDALAPVSKDAPAAKSVAVLPFVALSSGEDDGYFADGLSEEIINALTTLPDLLVTARTSAFYFKGKDTPIPEIARTLGVAHVVEGSVRRSGDKARISAQLIRASDNFHLWSQTYDRNLDDVFAAQTDIAENVARALEIYLDENDRKAMQHAGVGDVDAYIAYQKGYAAYDDAHDTAPQIETLMKANAYFEDAIARVPDFADAFLLHSDLYSHVLRDAAVGAAPTASGRIGAQEALRLLHRDLSAARDHAKTSGRLAHADYVLTLMSSTGRAWRRGSTRCSLARNASCRSGFTSAPYLAAPRRP